MRIIVLETELDELEVGKLFIVTYKGDSVHISKVDHFQIILLNNILTKFHVNFQTQLKFKYSHKKSLYQVADLSMSGTILQGIDISSSNAEEKSFVLMHGSVLEVRLLQLFKLVLSEAKVLIISS